MAQVIAFAAAHARPDADGLVRCVLVCACALALAFAGQPFITLQ